ncbi:MAG: phosphoribosylformylglycinamidine synthase subunit PurS [Pseudomonadota bacterium]
MKARVFVTLKPGVLDPQGAAVQHALGTLGFTGIGAVRQGKVLEFDMDTADAQAAEADLARMCEALLANTVIEDYRIEVPAP